MIKEKIEKKKKKKEKDKKEEKKTKNVIDNINNFYSDRITELKERIKSEKIINESIHYEKKKNLYKLEKEKKDIRKGKLNNLLS